MFDNEEVDLRAEVVLDDFPERLEDHGIVWKIYQNEIWLPIGVCEVRIRRLARQLRRQSAGVFTAVPRAFCRAAPPPRGERAQNLPGEIDALQHRSRQRSSGSK